IADFLYRTGLFVASMTSVDWGASRDAPTGVSHYPPRAIGVPPVHPGARRRIMNNVLSFPRAALLAAAVLLGLGSIPALSDDGTPAPETLRLHMGSDGTF